MTPLPIEYIATILIITPLCCAILFGVMVKDWLVSRREARQPLPIPDPVAEARAVIRASYVARRRASMEREDQRRAA
jgi:hypothetical protein